MIPGQMCENCAAFSATTKECRRKSPVMVPVPTGPKTVEGMGIFPFTSKDRWCGEWMPDRPPASMQ